MTKLHNLQIEYVPINFLKPAAYNPRTWDASTISQLTESITQNGFVDPILVNKTPKRKFTVIGGHFRLEVAKSLGYTEVPVIFLNIPDIEKEKMLNIRLNKNVGSWDIEKLREFETGFLAEIGFNSDELENIWDEALDIHDDSFDLDEALSAIKKPGTKLGDLYQLGRHRLLCADSTDPESVKKLMGGEKAVVIYCDPPFNINLDYNKIMGARFQIYLPEVIL